MRSIPADPFQDQDLVETLPATESDMTESAPPPSDSWDSEAPTAVHSRRPLFAGPPRLPST